MTTNLFRVCTECKPVIVVQTGYCRSSSQPLIQYFHIVQEYAHFVGPSVSSRFFFVSYGTTEQSRLTSKIIKSRYRTIWTSQSSRMPVRRGSQHQPWLALASNGNTPFDSPVSRHPDNAEPRLLIGHTRPRRRPARPILPRGRSPPSGAAGASWPHPPGSPGPAVPLIQTRLLLPAG